MIYFDNAATTYPKPRSVYRVATEAMLKYGGNPGRSGHILSREASNIVYDCREEIASLFDCSPENVVFTLNATYALNIAINALKSANGSILISSFEHNAVLRPAYACGDYRIFDASGDDDNVFTSFVNNLKPKPSLVVCNHMSNLCGRILPVERIGKICKSKGIPFIIDASQSAGRVKISLRDSCADAICAPGHKGLFGIQGCGFAIFSDKSGKSAELLNEFVYGGNGVDSLERSMPDFLPERLEAGTLPTPSVAALAEGIRFVKKISLSEIAYREELLGKRLREGLSAIKGAQIYGGEYSGGNLLFNLNGVSSEMLSEYLDNCGICVRGGYHCCPLGHKTLGTPDGGAVRASFSPLNSAGEVDRMLYSLIRY